MKHIYLPCFAALCWLALNLSLTAAADPPPNGRMRSTQALRLQFLTLPLDNLPDPAKHVLRRIQFHHRPLRSGIRDIRLTG